MMMQVSQYCYTASAFHCWLIADGHLFILFAGMSTGNLQQWMTDTG